MKLLIAGSRGITNVNLSQYIPKETTVIISGGARGIDTLAEKYADDRRISKIILKPRYDLYGRAAPIKRDDEMANMCDRALIFWNGKSKGTKHTINYLRKIGKDMKIVTINSNGIFSAPRDEVTITEHIKELCQCRNWTYYRLAKESGIPHSSLNTLLNKQHVPSLHNLMKICGGFDMTLTEFFAGMETPPDELRKVVNVWNGLDKESKWLAMTYMHGLSRKEML